MSRLPWVPRYVRDLRDFDYLDRLSTKDREWLLQFSDEYYGATAHGISEPEHIAEANRRRQSLRVDLFSSGLRASGGLPDSVGAPSTAQLTALDTPKARELLKKLCAVRPEFDETDGRRRARFKSVLAERRFYQLRQQLAALLEEVTP